MSECFKVFCSFGNDKKGLAKYGQTMFIKKSVTEVTIRQQKSFKVFCILEVTNKKTKG